MLYSSSLTFNDVASKLVDYDVQEEARVPKSTISSGPDEMNTNSQAQHKMNEKNTT